MAKFKYYESDKIISELQEKEIFVFGSNEAGIHGSGAAWAARNLFGARLGVGVGLTGQTYAIPTKDTNIETLPLDAVEGYVKNFIRHANALPNYTFLVTKVGCGLAGYTDADIAPMFRNAPTNCVFNADWEQYLE